MIASRVEIGDRARVAAEANRIDGEAGPRQRRAQDLGDANFVLDHQESHVHTLLFGRDTPVLSGGGQPYPNLDRSTPSL